jgi:hypothetical protein
VPAAEAAAGSAATVVGARTGFVDRDVVYDCLKPDPRYSELLKKLGLAE